mgnify:CR=1 FL=1
MTDASFLRSDPHRHRHPFAFFHYEATFEPADCAALERLFVGEHAWQHRSKGGYACALREVSDDISPTLKQTLVAEIQRITATPLMSQVQVTAQLMAPGQYVGEHSDHPQLGYEVARLIVYLNRDWQPEDGGLLELLDGPDGAATQVPPRYNHGFAFLLHALSLHRVTQVQRTRRSVVFNFWHPANSPALAEAVAALLAGMHFSELPAVLDAVVSQVEAQLDEDTSFRANVAAVVLHRWGYDAHTAAAGYFQCAGLPWPHALPDQRSAVIKLAVWIATLHQGIFDLDAWQRLDDALGGITPPSEIRPIWQLCLPRRGD